MVSSPFSNPFSNPFVNPFVNPFGNTSPTTQPLVIEDRYLNFLAGHDGCGQYRRGFLENHINMCGLGDSMSTTKMIFDKMFYRGFKTITLQRQASPQQKEFYKFLKSIQPEFGFRIIYEVDDVVFREEIPDYNASKHGFDTDEVRQNCIDMINMSDEVTVTCDFMRKLYQEKTGKKEITVVPNFMPYWWSGHQYNYRQICDNLEKNKKRPRVVYAGSGAHFDVKNLAGQKDDFEHVLKFIIDNRFKYQFVFMGAYPPPLHPFIQAKEIEFHPWIPFLHFPTFLSQLGAQAFIAPLQENNFNRAKSDIKFVEAAQLGIPCLCQNIETYSTAPDFLRFNTAEELEHKLDQIVNWKNKAKYYKLIPDLRKFGETRFLEQQQNIGAWMEVLNHPYGSPERRFLKNWN